MGHFFGKKSVDFGTLVDVAGGKDLANVTLVRFMEWDGNC
jgi:hypothetical protein